MRVRVVITLPIVIDNSYTSCRVTRPKDPGHHRCRPQQAVRRGDLTRGSIFDGDGECRGINRRTFVGVRSCSFARSSIVISKLQSKSSVQAHVSERAPDSARPKAYVDGVVAPRSESPQKRRRRVGLVLRSPSSRRRALSSGLIARDQIARVKQAALECREAEHSLKVGAPMQKSISGVLLPRQRAFVERRLA